MSLFSADVNDLKMLYVESLRKALNSERRIMEEGLPTMIEAAKNPELTKAFRTHLAETKEHVARLEKILGELQGEADDKKCKVTAALIAEANSEVSDAGNNRVSDVMLIAAGNKVEHHEIAVYGTLATWAGLLGETKQAAMLEKTLKEEKHADEVLTRIAEKLNVKVPIAA